METWVMGPEVILDSKGCPSHGTKYQWIGNYYAGPSIADDSTACSIALPLNPHAILSLINHLEVMMGHNFNPMLLVLGATAMATHYSTIRDLGFHCPVPLIFGSPGTGKTTALRSGLSLLGCTEQRMFSKATKEKYASLCSTTTLPLIIDDPRSKDSISDLVMSLYNGAYEGTLSRGHGRPSTMAIIGANFTTSEQEQ